MKYTSRIITVGTIATLLGLSGCVLDPGMRGEYGHGRNQDRQGSNSQHDYRDRNGQPCNRQGDDRHDRDDRDSRDGHHDDDCRPYRP
jgi:hypothetical protein